MIRYRVCFEGKWQGAFDDRNEALAWGHEVGETGRIVHVVRQRLFSSKLVAVYPESEAEEGKRLWKGRAVGSDFGGGKIT